MINSNMHIYNYFTYGEDNAYGQKQLSEVPVGKIKMAIYLTSQAVQENINYTNAQFVGLTHAKVDDSYVIEYGEDKLKVLYVNSFGRYNQVFMERM